MTTQNKAATGAGILPRISGKRNARLSWEKQEYFDLSNGVRATVEFGHYGQMITRLDDALGCWHCSDGIIALPQRFSFALAWCEPYLSHTPEAKLMRPKFVSS